MTWQKFIMASSALVGLLAFLFVFRLDAFAATETVAAPDWKSLNTTVKGRLHVGIPFSRPCFAVANTSGVFDQAACTNVQQNYMNEGEFDPRSEGKSR
jgi:hypothetical protein